MRGGMLVLVNNGYTYFGGLLVKGIHWRLCWGEGSRDLRSFAEYLVFGANSGFGVGKRTAGRV